MTISVIVPVYNVERYLDKCVASILAQSYTDYELILVDDGSTDQSGVMCDQYANRHECVRVIHQQNKGLGGARNAGIDVASGEYLLFIDSDDFVDADMLRICAERLASNPCDMLIFDQQAVLESGENGSSYTCPLVSNTVVDSALAKSLLFFSGACNRVFHRRLFLESGIRFPNRLWYEDLRTVPKLFLLTEKVYYYHDKPLYFYLQRSGSIMHTPDFLRIVDERVAAVAEIIRHYKEQGLFDAYREELEFLWLFHGFFLPVREMQSMSSSFGSYAEQLRQQLFENFPSVAENRYIAEQLNGKERFFLKCALHKRYTTIWVLSFVNKVLKRLRHVQ